MLLQFSSAQGPEECCIAVEKTLNYFLTVTEQRQVDVIILEQEPSRYGLKSVLVSLKGAEAKAIAQQWSGTVQWQCTSTLRPKHKRKNWFIGIAYFDPPQEIQDTEILFETMRAMAPEDNMLIKRVQLSERRILQQALASRSSLSEANMLIKN